MRRTQKKNKKKTLHIQVLMKYKSYFHLDTIIMFSFLGNNQESQYIVKPFCKFNANTNYIHYIACFHLIVKNNRIALKHLLFCIILYFKHVSVNALILTLDENLNK